jgi:hypothetical protein
MSTLRVSNIEAKADVSSPTVDEKIKFTNSSGDVLFHLDGKTSGITTVGINTTGNTFTVNNTTGDISFSGSVTSSGVSTFTSDVSIADKIVHIGDTDTAIRFPSADTITAETGGSERLRITSSGNVGIGTDNPTSKLEVYNSSSTPVVKISGPTSGSSALEFYASTTKNGALLVNSSGFLIAADNSNPITFNAGGSERLRITSSGNIGINSTSPKTNLDISQQTGAVALPQGTTAQRPSGNAPYIRYNTTNSALEFYNGTDWVEIISDYFPSGSTILE